MCVGGMYVHEVCGPTVLSAGAHRRTEQAEHDDGVDDGVDVTLLPEVGGAELVVAAQPEEGEGVEAARDILELLDLVQ